MKFFKHQLFYPTLLLCTILAACNQSSQNTAVSESDTTKTPQSKLNRDSLLIPGVSAGNIAIEQDASEALKTLGKPDSSDAAMQKTVAFWYKEHDPRSTSFAIYTVRDTGSNPIARIRQIRLNSPAYRTEDGLGVSSPLSLLKDKFDLKKVSLSNASPRNYDLYDSHQGIAFEITAEGNCAAVIIHRKNEPLKETYLPLR
ncbi:hypothetical protein QG516_06720 [Pedobacter gandavensis]|uniref:hypothetical protein n=1 Tax=Pedobacter TaxID=84567 RepID=UPI001C99CAA1|nr:MULTISPECIES: hypothetical protein [Pedobacter]WGQ11346.1 hypothetical protein QG516_06720 [Pedobacter gandavensis]